MVKKQRAVVFMLTANYAFALAAMLVNLRQTNAGNYDDVVVYHDGLSETECLDLQRIEPNIRFIYYGLENWKQEHTVFRDSKQDPFLRRFSHFSLSKYKMFEQLAHYHQVLFLDLDMIVYGDLSPIFALQGMAWRTEALFVNKFGATAGKPEYAGLDAVPNTHPAPNGGLIYAEDSIDWQGCLAEARNFINTFSGSFASVLDELTFSWVAHRFGVPITELNHRQFNTLPRVVDEHTVVAHFMGQEKPWNSELMQLAHPVWMRHYAMAKAQGQFESDKVTYFNSHGQILRKHLNQARWLKLFTETNFPSVLASHLTLSFNLDSEMLAILHSRDVHYHLTLNRNMDVYKLSFELENKLLIKDNAVVEALKRLAEQNGQFELQTHAHKLVLITKAAYSPEQLNDAWRYFYRVTWAIVESFV